ncbi:hypothetical protein ANPL_02245 [Anaplasma platys]|uniref:Uncharacterized protein n=1 Tax=Anaplasma platys TaxID=949 RepID=A0A858PY81_9RICK|nr:hypothetical protein [Anaplasma platys]QJC27527.1 hypothetical protein ANPL_02245 [Anaplasma platys]
MLYDGRTRVTSPISPSITRPAERIQIVPVAQKSQIRNWMALTILFGLVAVMPLLLAYWITQNMVVLSVLHVCYSLFMCAVLSPPILYDCNRMVRCVGEETDKISTTICVIASLFSMSSYVMVIVWGSSIAQSARIICGIIDFVTLVVLPVLWIVSRAIERYTRVNCPDVIALYRLEDMIGSLQIVRSNDTSNTRVVRPVENDMQYQVGGRSYQIARVPTFVQDGEVYPGVMSLDFYDVESALRREGIYFPQTFELGV